MLDRIRKSSQSFLIYAIFGLLIAIFVISFGPQSRGVTCEAATADDHYAARVAGELVTKNDFRFGYLFMGGARAGAQVAKQRHLKEMVMDKLIERELLAAEGERLGYVVSDEEVDDMLGDARVMGLGYPSSAQNMTKEGKFNYDAFKNFVQFELGLTPQGFIDEQKKELLAARVRDLLRGSVAVSPSEVQAEFLRKNTQVNLEYVRFAGRAAEDAVQPTAAEIADYAAKNEAKLKAMYDERKFVYEKVPRELKLRQIFVKVPSDAKPDAEAAAKARATALAARVKKGEAFEKVVQDSDTDASTKARGGELGWRGHGAANLPGDPEKELYAAKKGDVVGPLKGSGGFYITRVEDDREGNIPFERVKLDLAEEKVRSEAAGAQAKALALAALAEAKKEPTKTLKDLFPAPADDAAPKDGKTPAKAKAAAPNAPRAEETGLFAAQGTREGARVEGIGVSNDLAKAAFGLTTAAPLAGPFEVAGSWVVVRLKERKDPDMADFEKKKDDLRRDAELTKGNEVLTDWTHARCIEARDAKRITINRDELRYEDSGEPPAYEPCVGAAMRHQFGG
jgi:peptidyl-prolyl cis-trans isomerase D